MNNHSRILILLLIFTFGEIQAKEKFTFVIDLDETLLLTDIRRLSARDQASFATQNQTAFGQGRWYRIAHGGREIILSLGGIEGCEIGVFSANTLRRRTQEVADLMFKAYPLEQPPLQFVYDSQSITRAGNPENAEYWEFQGDYKAFIGKHKKVLDGVHDTKGRTVIYIDDEPFVAPRGMEKNIIWARNAKSNLEMARIRGLIDIAIELSEAMEMPMTQILWMLQWKATANEIIYRRNAAEHELVIQRGIELLKETNPSFDPYAAHLKVLRHYQEAPKKPMQLDPDAPPVYRQVPRRWLGVLLDLMGWHRYELIASRTKDENKLTLDDLLVLPLPKEVPKEDRFEWIPRPQGLTSLGSSPKPGKPSEVVQAVYQKKESFTLANGREYKILRRFSESDHKHFYIIVPVNGEGPTLGLKIAKSDRPPARAAIQEEIDLFEAFREHNIPHLPVIESGRGYLIREWVQGDGVETAKDWIARWNAAGKPSEDEKAQGLIQLLNQSLAQRAYIEQLRPSNVVWDGSRWLVASAKSVKRKETSDILDRYEERIPRRWGFPIGVRDCKEFILVEGEA